MAYIGFMDILRRGVYSRRGLEKLMARGEFPAPAFAINAGRNKVWFLADVLNFESSNPSFTSEAAKRRKVAGYAVALSKKRKKN